MVMNAHVVLLLIAAICFLLAAKPPYPGVNFQNIGFAFVALAYMFP
jgi:hypothetical protein